MPDKPLTEEELRAKIATTKIKFADDYTVNALWPQVRIILDALKDFGFGSAMVSDETCFSDFCLSNDELEELGAKIGVALDPSNEDDWWLVRVAAKMRNLDSHD